MIDIYATATCPWCKKAKLLCDQYGLKHRYIVMDTPELQAEFKEKFPGAKTVPQITWHGRRIGGYEDLVDEIQNTRTYGDGAI